MTREILFRGKLRKDGRWCFGNLNVKKDGVAIITPDDTLIGVYGQVDPATVGQYTGLTDKNGKPIFEGDLIRNIENENIGRITYVSEYCAVMIYSRSENRYYWLYDNDFKNIEVIGNIHDNPELLEVVKP